MGRRMVRPRGMAQVLYQNATRAEHHWSVGHGHVTSALRGCYEGQLPCWAVRTDRCSRSALCLDNTAGDRAQRNESATRTAIATRQLVAPGRGAPSKGDEKGDWASLASSPPPTDRSYAESRRNSPSEREAVDGHAPGAIRLLAQDGEKRSLALYSTLLVE